MGSTSPQHKKYYVSDRPHFADLATAIPGFLIVQQLFAVQPKTRVDQVALAETLGVNGTPDSQFRQKTVSPISSPGILRKP